MRARACMCACMCVHVCVRACMKERGGGETWEAGGVEASAR